MRRTSIYDWLNYLLIGGVALLLRVLDLGRFLNSDEINFWIDRSHTFLRAIQSGDYAATAISTHPGVTTMWLGSMGVLLRRLLFENGILTNETFPIILTLMRLPLVLLHTGGILLGYLLLRRLFAPPVATLAALLWATSPFITAFSRILHVDGLTGTFATLSLLAACVFWNEHQHRGWLVLSGICGALAVLSKSPGLAVVPVVTLLAFAAAWQRGSGAENAECRMQNAECSTQNDGRGSGVGGQEQPSGVTALFTRLLPAIPQLALWGAVFALTLVIVWPAVWADPARVYELLRVGVEVEGSIPHVIVNYFLGEINPEPGPLYYPVVLAIRMTPWVMPGLLLLPIAMRGEKRTSGQDLPQRRKERKGPDRRGGGPTGSSREKRHRGLPAANPTGTIRTLAVLAGFVILFIVAMSFFAKKLDRYLVVTFPAVNILAAYGLVQTASLWQKTTAQQTTVIQRYAPALVVLVVALLAIGNTAWWHPYGVAYFNQLTGGIQTGVRTILIGEGEGLGDAAKWLNRQPDITGVTTTSTMIHTLQAFLRDGAQAVSPNDGKLDDATGYILVYIRHMQRWGNDPPPPYDQYYGRLPPTHAVTVHGVDYAHIYQVPQPMEHRVEANFGEAIQLYGYEVDISTLRSSNVISLTTQWKARQPAAEDYHMFIHVLDQQGNQVAQVDVPPAGAHAPTPSWETNRYTTWVHPIPLPADLPAGRYWLSLGIYRPADFSRLPVTGSNPPVTAPDDGPHTLFLEPLVVE